VCEVLVDAGASGLELALGTAIQAVASDDRRFECVGLCLGKCACGQEVGDYLRSVLAAQVRGLSGCRCAFLAPRRRHSLHPLTPAIGCSTD
jgi:hypothetical protein